MKIFKRGELVYVSGGIYDVRHKESGYAVIVDIIDRQTKESYFEKEIITGRGDKNTKVDIVCDFLYESKSNDIDDFLTGVNF